MANPAGTGLVISEVYLNGGSAGATYTNKYVELYNPTAAAINVDGMSIQYRSATGSGSALGVTPLNNSVPAHGHYLVQGSSNSTNGTALPTPDATGGFNPSGSAGVLILANQTTALTIADLPTGDSSGNAKVVDLLGYGAANTFEKAAGPAGPGLTSTLQRSATGVDSDTNSADFTAVAPSPENAGPTTPPPPPTDPVRKTIPEIQGTTDTSPLVGTSAITSGVVTAAYPTGGFNGFYLQTPGTGGAVDLATQTASDGLFVYLGKDATADAYPAIGAHVEVTGPVSEAFGMTQVTPAAGGVVALTGTVAAPKPAQVDFPASETSRESLEGMLIAPQGRYTVADNYSLNQYGEIGLARGGSVLHQPTDVARPNSPEAAAVVAVNAARAVKLDDGATTNFLSGASKNLPLPYLTKTQPVRVGAGVDFNRAVIFDYRNSAWKFQPTTALDATNADTVQPATFENTRTARPEAVGGDLKIASLNVLNYFTETGADWVADGGTCSYYTDRDGNKITVNSCNGEGPRGAANTTNRLRQQEKTVATINGLGADVLSLEEIENSAKYAGENRRDDALSTLVDALNTDLGAQVWDYVRSPKARPSLAEEDVIRTAFIYKKAKVQAVGTSKILTGSAAFSNAREPLAQVFKPAGGTLSQQFVVIVNHFKSKGSGTGADADQNDGQGASNASRVNQAKALVAFAKEVSENAGTKQVFLTGDFNSYTQEDPMQVLYQAGFTDIGSAKTDESTYLFDGVVGSLDHVLANAAGYQQVAGADVWNINSVESVAYEYSRYNYNATNFYAPTQFRSSDHDPLLVGINKAPADDEVMLNLININDFHGRIDANTTKFATTVERLRDGSGDDSTLFMSAGDNIGGSLFASALDNDNPTIDVLNALDMSASAVGNHEFDQGYDDLKGHVADRANWTYIGANVFHKGTTDPALPEYKVSMVNGVRVGVIGAVTEETPSLVSPGGITGLEFGHLVDSVNRVANQLTDGNVDNGEADVLVAEYHEGSGAGTADGANLEQQVAKGGAFADIVTKTSPKVAAIFTGHTHKQYAWDAPVPGMPGKTRPVVQTGQYGENVGQVRMLLDSKTGSVTSYTARNVARATVADLGYPRVQAVKTIVDSALAAAEVKGGVPVGGVTSDITRAFTNGTYVGDVYQGGTAEDRASESTIGDLVANSLVTSLSDPTRGGAEIGVVNPGGLRADLGFAGVAGSDTNKDGVITYAEANAVLPFVNNLWTITLTGEQFENVLEQQWQTNPDGTIPSRPFLHLGLSDNVSTTLDPSKPAGERVTSVLIDGVPLDPAKEYRIGTFSFLAQGGDNFREFANGTNVKDSGLVDRDAWIDYLKANNPVSPAFDRRQVYGENVPAEIKGGDPVAFTLDRLNLTSNGSPVNKSVDVVLRSASGDTALGSFDVVAGTANISFTAPSTIPAGATVVAVASPSGTTVTIPTGTTVAEPAESTTTASVSPAKIVVGQTRATVTATVMAGAQPVTDGSVSVYSGGTNLGTAPVTDGKASVLLPKFSSVGARNLSVEYSGSSTTEASATTVRVNVVKATPKMRVVVKPGTIHRKRTHAKLAITLTAPGQTVKGYVNVRTGGKLVTRVHLKAGAATATLPTFKKTGRHAVYLRYLGGDLANEVSKRIIIRVVK